MTLVEILVVVAIIALVTAVTAVGVIKLGEDAKKRATVQALSHLRQMAAVARSRGLADCPTPAELRRDKMLDAQFPKEDPWGTPFSILCNEDEIQARSAGPDRAVDTGDDLWAPPPEGAGKR